MKCGTIKPSICNKNYFPLDLQTQNSVYEIVSDMSSRQDAVEERLSSLEDKMQGLQVYII